MSIPISMAADPSKLQVLKNLLGSDAFFKTVGKTILGSRAFKNKDNLLGENIIDSLNAGHPALLLGNAASKGLTGKNLREGFTDSGVVDVPFASQYLSY
jgi:hypothetical protein